MVVFNGKMRLKVIEADNIRATEHSTRYFPQNPSLSFVSPYVSIDIDDLPLGRTHTKEKTATPAYNEEFSSEVHSGHQLHFTIFHDAALPPDEYVADCTLRFETIHDKKSDIWINLEPTGRIHVSIELQGQFSDCKCSDEGGASRRCSRSSFLVDEWQRSATSGISSKTSAPLLSVVLPSCAVSTKSTDTNSWQRSFGSRHFAQSVRNSSGKRSLLPIVRLAAIVESSRRHILIDHLLILPGVYFVRKAINVKVGIRTLLPKHLLSHPSLLVFPFDCVYASNVNRTDIDIHDTPFLSLSLP